VDLDPARRVPEVLLVHDRVPAIDRLRLVPRDAHGHRAGDPGPFEVPHRAATQIMEQGPRETGRLAGLAPRASEFLDGLAPSVEDRGG
jgi:hypothetical protein